MKGLETAHSDLTRPAEAVWRRSAVAIIPGGGVAALARGRAGRRCSRGVRAKLVGTMPEIERLQATARSLDAVRLARQIERYAPEDSTASGARARLQCRDRAGRARGADQELRRCRGAWERSANLDQHLRLPVVTTASASRSRATFRLSQRQSDASTISSRLKRRRRPGCPSRGGMYGDGVAAYVQLPDYWIDRYEFTNREFKVCRCRRLSRRSTRTEPSATEIACFPLRMRLRVSKTPPIAPDPPWDLGASPRRRRISCRRNQLVRSGRVRGVYGQELPSLYPGIAHPEPIRLLDIITLSISTAWSRTRRRTPGCRTVGTWDIAGNVREWCVNIAQGSHGGTSWAGAERANYRFTEATPEILGPWADFALASSRI